MGVAGSGDWEGISGMFSGAATEGITVTAIGPSFWCCNDIRSVIHLLRTCNCRLAPCAFVTLYWLHLHHVADFQLWKILCGSVAVLCLFKLTLA